VTRLRWSASTRADGQRFHSANHDVTGYTLPLSPDGSAAYVPPPPWHFSGNVLLFDYDVEPSAAESLLPAALDPGPHIGRAAALFAEWQWATDAGEEYLDPAQSQFREFCILLQCEHQGRAVARCPIAWVDQSVSILRGWIQGFPKQHGDVWLTRAVMAGRGGPKLDVGSRFAAFAAVNGRPLARAEIMLSGRAKNPPPVMALPLAHTRHFPKWQGGASVDELVIAHAEAVEFGAIWHGEAHLEIITDSGPLMHALTPIGLGSAYAFSYGETLTGGAPGA
jgi:enduracididine biosynthesis enzyme MppR